MTRSLLTSQLHAPSASRVVHRKIRVAYFINSLQDGGAERQLLQLLKCHDRNQFSFSLVLMDGQYADRAQGLVDDVFVMSIRPGGNSNWFPRGLDYANAIRRTAAYLRQSRPDIVHALLPGPSILGGIAAAFADIPLFIRSPRSMLTLYRARTRLASWLDCMFLRRSDFSIGNSEAVLREMIEIAKCPPNKCGRIYNGVDTERFHPELSRAWRKSVGWSDDNVVFGLVGNYTPAKRHSDFVEFADLLSKRYPQARFLMVGADYGMKHKTVEQIEDRGLMSKFSIVDQTPDPAHIFASLDVYVCASLTEGFSNVLLEAMACGKPVIATDAGGNAEAVADGETGFIVPIGDPPAIAHAAEILLCDSALRRSMGASGRRRAEERFSLQAMTQATEQLYLKLVHSAWQMHL